MKWFYNHIWITTIPAPVENNTWVSVWRLKWGTTLVCSAAGLLIKCWWQTVIFEKSPTEACLQSRVGQSGSISCWSGAANETGDTGERLIQRERERERKQESPPTAGDTHYGGTPEGASTWQWNSPANKESFVLFTSCVHVRQDVWHKSSVPAACCWQPWRGHQQGSQAQRLHLSWLNACVPLYYSGTNKHVTDVVDNYYHGDTCLSSQPFLPMTAYTNCRRLDKHNKGRGIDIVAFFYNELHI